MGMNINLLKVEKGDHLIRPPGQDPHKIFHSIGTWINFNTVHYRRNNYD